MRSMMEYLLSAESILILAHEAEDADAIGSGLALMEVLRAAGKRADFLLSDEPEQHLKFMVQEPWVYADGMEIPEYELCAAIDCGDLERIGKRRFLFERAKKTVNIDHHYTNPEYGMMNLVDGSACAAGEILCEMFQKTNTPLTDEAAKNLYIAIMSDSGGLRYESASPKTLRLTADLMEYGFDHAQLCRKLFDSQDYRVLELRAHVVQNIHRYFENRLAVVSLSEEIFDDFGVSEKDTGDLVNLPRSLTETEIAVSLRETPEKIKISFRSNGRYNVAEIAEKIGGGGHKMAAGARIEGKSLEEAEKIIFTLCKDVLK